MNREFLNIKFFVLMLLVGVFSIYDVRGQAVDDSIRHRPTVGVVLCGGGAKGFSHIRILKAIDEAGVPVDCIGGTSIGAIIGALYAVGYDPDEMEKIVRAQNWDEIMYDKVPKTLLPVENKMYDRHYLATFPISDGKIKVKPSLVDGVCVNQLMSRLMLPACGVDDFNDLPVQFFCVATDVEHARQYEMTRGNLARSVRASMSIPFLFKPVTIDDRVLIDGGMVNNFPVRNMQERGVDIIIGIDLEDDVIPASQIDNSLGLLEGMMQLASLDESNYARTNCDIYIKPNLHGRTMMSFNDFDSIFYFGEEAAQLFYPKLKSLADSLYAIEPYEIKRPHVKQIEKINVVDIDVQDMEENHKTGIKREFGKKFPMEMSLDYIQDVIVKLHASGYYEDLWYETEETQDGVLLKIHGKECDDKSLAFCIHYDNNYGIGTLVNFNVKNLWKSMNRTTLNLDANIAENPYVRLSLNRRYGRYFRYGADVSVVSLNIKNYNDSKILNSYNIQSNSLNIYSQIVPSLTQQIRIGAVVDYVRMFDNIETTHRTLDIEKDYSFYSYLYLHYFYGNEDAPNFARRGWRISLLGKCLFFEGKNENGTLSNVGSQMVYTFQENIEKSFKIGSKNSLKLGVQSGMKVGEASVPRFYQYLVGGQSRMKYFNNIISFTGLNFVDKIVDYVAFGKMAWQWNFYKIFYTTVNCDFGYMNSDYDLWFDSGSFVMGCGLSFGADTVVGPVIVSLMGSNQNSSLIGFINVGYWF
ncbi:MAG: patatin-like phospholipase family protein [Bacteroidales bacterium]|nr:patatin-like phospholipase family protein [Bacteroidales bacterium]